MILAFLIFSLKLALSLPCSPSSRGSLVPLHFQPLEWYHPHIWSYWCFSHLSWFQLVIYPAQHFSWCVQHIDEYVFSVLDLKPISCSIQGSNCWFLTHIQVSQETGKMVWYFHLSKSFAQFVMIHTVNGFSVVDETEMFFWNSIFIPIPKKKWSRSVVSDSLRGRGLVAYQAPPSMGFSRQEYWSGLPFPSPRDLPDPGTKPGSPAFQRDALTSEPPGKQLRRVYQRMC